MLSARFLHVLALMLVFQTAVSAGPHLVLSRESAVDYALEHNAEALSAREEIEAASARLAGARSEFFPRLEAVGSYSMYRNHPTMPFDDNLGYRLEASQPVFTGGRLTGARLAAVSELEAARFGSREVLNYVRFAVIDAFYGVLLADEFVEINREAYELAAELLETVEKRFDRGEASRYEVLRHRVEAENVRSDAVRAENNAETAMNALISVLGAPAGASVRLYGELDFSERAPDAGKIGRLALRRRPRLMELNALREAAASRTMAASAGRLPSVFLSAANIANRQEPFAEDRSNYDDYWEARVSVVFSIFDGGLVRSRVNEAKSAERRMELLYEQAEREVLLEVNNALLAMGSAAERAEFQKENAAAAEEAYKIINSRYRAGQASYLDVMDARLALSRARLNYAESLRDYSAAMARLEFAAGGPVLDDEDLPEEE